MKLLTKITLFLIIIFAGYMAFQFLSNMFNGEYKFSFSELFRSKSEQKDSSNKILKNGDYRIVKKNEEFQVLWNEKSIWNEKYDELYFDKENAQFLHFILDSTKGYLNIISPDTIEEVIFHLIVDFKSSCDLNLPSGIATARIFINRKCDRTYTGEFFCDYPNGEGTVITHEKFYYCKNWINCEMNGYGRETNLIDSNLFTHEGYFFRDELWGVGRMTSRYSGSYYGEFKKGSFNGFGIYNWATSNDTYLKYEGNFLNGESEGKGIEYLKNGTTNNGYFHKDNFVGENYSDYENSLKAK